MLKSAGKRALAPLLLVVVLGAETQCAPSTPPPALPLKAKLAPVKTEFQPPTWSARFGKPAGLVQCTPLGEHSRLCVGALGERWLDEERGASASPFVAPEDLVAALPTDSKTWVFVGRHGTRYAADTPLGPFTSVRRPPRKFSQFAVQGGQWFGITNDGELWRGALSDGQGSRANVPGHLFNFAMAPSGKGLAIAAPEQLWLTEDNGTQWTRLAAGPFGTRAIASDNQGAFVLSAALASGEVTNSGVTIRTTLGLPNTAIQLEHAPRAYPEAQALIEGRCSRLGKELVELRSMDGHWYLGRGPLEGPFAFSKVEGLDECTDARFAISETSSIVVCRKGRAHSDLEPLTVFLSNEHAEHFTPLRDPIRGQFGAVRLAAAGAHRFFATGLCEPRESRAVGAHSACRNAAPLGLQLAGGSPGQSAGLLMQPVTAPDATTSAPVLAATNDGTRVAFMAHGAKSAWHVYLSTDSGATFAARSIDDVPVTSAASGIAKPNPKATRESRDILSMHFGDDQSLSVVYRNGDAPIIANFDARGDLVATAMAPPGVARADAIGPRILAFSRTERNVYESLDRGASFELVDHLPGPACLSWLDCSLSCTPEGCLIGERFTRLHWGGRGLHRLDNEAAPEAERLDVSSTDLVSFRTPLSCQPQAQSGTASSPLQFAPLPEQVGLKDMLWVSPWQDWATASAGAYRARRSASRVDKLTALAPLTHPERAGIAVNYSDAGFAVLRAESLPKIGEPTGDLELAWLPAGRSSWAHARFRDAAAFKTNDSYLYGTDKARRLLPEVLAVSSDDAFVQVHADDERKLGTYFASKGKTELLPRIEWPFASVRSPHWLKNGNGFSVFAFDDTGTELLFAFNPTRDNSAGWQFSAQTLVEPFGTRASIQERVQAHFAGSEPYIALAFTARGRPMQSLRLHPMRAQAAPIGPGFDVRLPEAMGEPPPACNARDRRELRRVVVPLLPAAARALGFTSNSGRPLWLVVSHAVMYASEQRACIDTLWAESLPGVTPIRAVVPLEDTKHAWLFLSNRAHGESRMDALPVECRFDVTASPPPEFETRTQARYNLEHLPLE